MRSREGRREGLCRVVAMWWDRSLLIGWLAWRFGARARVNEGGIDGQDALQVGHVEGCLWGEGPGRESWTRVRVGWPIGGCAVDGAGGEGDACFCTLRGIGGQIK